MEKALTGSSCRQDKNMDIALVQTARTPALWSLSAARRCSRWLYPREVLRVDDTLPCVDVNVTHLCITTWQDFQ